MLEIQQWEVRRQSSGIREESQCWALLPRRSLDAPTQGLLAKTVACWVQIMSIPIVKNIPTGPWRSTTPGWQVYVSLCKRTHEKTGYALASVRISFSPWRQEEYMVTNLSLGDSQRREKWIMYTEISQFSGSVLSNASFPSTRGTFAFCSFLHHFMTCCVNIWALLLRRESYTSSAWKLWEDDFRA